MSEISELILKHEGYRRFVYKDTMGIDTVGIGRNLKDKGISQAEALYLLEDDIAEVTKQLSDRLYWFDAAPDKVKLVMIDMCFNLGLAGFLQFHNTLEHLKNGDYKEASKDMLNSLWARQVGVRALEDAEILNNI